MLRNPNLSQKLRENPTNSGLKYKNPIQHHLDNPNSRKLAINAYCFQCCAGGFSTQQNQGVRKEIKLCPVTNCSLWIFRPYKSKEALIDSTPASASNSFHRNSEVANHE